MKGTIENLQLKSSNQPNAGKFMLSQIKDYSSDTEDSPFSIKWVLDGEETYNVDGKQRTISNGKFIIVNLHSPISTRVNSKQVTQGICIYPPHHIINEAYHYYTEPNELYPATISPNYYDSLIRDTKRTRTGRFMNKSLKWITLAPEKFDFNSFYLDLAGFLVEDQLELNEQRTKIKAVKKSTIQEVYERIYTVHEYLNDYKFKKHDIKDLAKLACLSEYHFIRSFKEIYNISPYQYLIGLKLDKAKELLIKGMPIKMVAETVGFSDYKNLKRQLKKQ